MASNVSNIVASAPIQAEGQMRSVLTQLARARGESRSSRSECLEICLAMVCTLVLASACARGQGPPPSSIANPPAREEVRPGDWAPELLYDVWSSPNPEASQALYRAAFAAGREVVPELAAALKDDRTAEFAAQSLAFIGGPRAFEILSKLVDDSRDLNLRRFFYGALGELETGEATRQLLGVVRRSDAEPDRTVTETAIIALTAHTNVSVIPALREAEPQLKDYVIRDDIENAIDVIQTRAHYLNSVEGRKPGVSIERAVRTYFIPALESPPEGPVPSAQAKTAGKPQNQRTARPVPGVEIKIQQLTFSPDNTRALARVAFEDPSAVAEYEMVLQKNLGDWTLASVWLGPEFQKATPGSSPRPTPHQ